MTVINTNIGALHAHQYSKKAELFVNKALERLSSGKRINQAEQGVRTSFFWKTYQSSCR